jgi:flagellar biosynthetic protein FlhB
LPFYKKCQAGSTHYTANKTPATKAAAMIVEKGQDFLGSRIKKLAKQLKIPVIENPPLTRALFSYV